MKRFIVVPLFLCILFLHPLNAGDYDFHEKVSMLIEQNLKKNPDSYLNRFYKSIYYIPVWVHEHKISSFSQSLLKSIETNRFNLPSAIYNKSLRLQEKASKIYSGGNIQDKLVLELEFSKLYNQYYSYLGSGGTDWSLFQSKLAAKNKAYNMDAKWVSYGVASSPANLLKSAIINGSLSASMDQKSEFGFNYDKLYEKLKFYNAVAQKEQIQKITIGKTYLKPGENSSAIPLIRKRLALTDELGGCSQNGSTLYDKCLFDVIKQFQARNGLSNSGVIGKDTLSALNESLASRARKIELNLDRIKQFNQRDEKYHVIINIPDFMLYFMDGKQVKKQMRVIVGDKKHPTPVFGSKVAYIVLNPYWNVPDSIIQKEFIPKMLKDPDAMKKENINITQGWAKDAPIVDPSTIDWNEYRYTKTVPFRFAQPPGYGNALGKIKFIFPNDFSVYMHDTPTKRLFKRDTRAFSHGCIRLSEPMEMLRIFSEIDNNVNLGNSKGILKGSKETNVYLAKSIPVDVVYLTAWVNSNGEIEFRDDVYGYDKLQLSCRAY
ncbi:MAG: L,D-transpeptidase family protein [Campylobacterales bacterium]|nr:L,D-transpeptidase family protein [Campylobacterales bacterium]